MIIYEGFNYSTSNVALTATGLTGSYGGSGNYNATGLTFSNLQTVGGKASWGNSGAITVGYRQLSTGNITGIIYGSFIYQQTASYGTNDVNAVGFGTSTTIDNTATIAFLADTYNNEVVSMKSDPNNTSPTAYSVVGTTLVPTTPPPDIVRVALFESPMSAHSPELNRLQCGSYRKTSSITSDPAD